MDKCSLVKETFEDFGYITLDCALEGNDLQKHLDETWIKYEIEARIFSNPGPSGWPEVKYIGRRSSIIEMAEQEYEEDEDTVNDFFERI